MSNIKNNITLPCEIRRRIDTDLAGKEFSVNDFSDLIIKYKKRVRYAKDILRALTKEKKLQKCKDGYKLIEGQVCQVQKRVQKETRDQEAYRVTRIAFNRLDKWMKECVKTRIAAGIEIDNFGNYI